MNAGNVFRAYDIRGVVDKDFNAEWVTHLGKACGTYLAGRGISSAVIGYDCRHSSPAYHDALVEGILSTGTDVISIGMVPTPALYFAVKHLNRQGGVMITASHNPPEYNGFKVWAGQSTIHGEEIQKIKAIFEEGAFAEGTGTASRIDIIPTYKQDILSRFKLARPVKVVLDGGNGAGGEICADILTKLGATVIPMFCEPDGDFPNHHPDPVVEANMQVLMARVKEEKADLGIGLDGDADRLGIVDPDGRLLFGDEVLSLYARELLTRKPGSTVIADVKCSSRLFNDIKAHGGTPMMWTTGHSIIKAKMQEVGAPLAGEMSGHMFFADNWYGFDDAIYGSVCRPLLGAGQAHDRTPRLARVLRHPRNQHPLPGQRQVRRGRKGESPFPRPLRHHRAGRRAREFPPRLGACPRVQHPARPRHPLRSGQRRGPRRHPRRDGNPAEEVD